MTNKSVQINHPPYLLIIFLDKGAWEGGFLFVMLILKLGQIKSRLALPRKVRKEVRIGPESFQPPQPRTQGLEIVTNTSPHYF